MLERYGRQPYRKENRLPDLAWSIFLFICLLGAILYCVVAVFNMEDINIKDAIAVGVKATDARIIEEFARESISGKYLGLFKRSNIFFYPKQNIEYTLKKNIARLNDVNVDVRGRVVVVSVSERLPVYLFCDKPREIRPRNCLYADSDGFVFDQAPELSGDLFFEFITSSSSPVLANSAAVGKHFLPSGIFAGVLGLKEKVLELAQEKIDPSIKLESVVVGKDDYSFILEGTGLNTKLLNIRFFISYDLAVKNGAAWISSVISEIVSNLYTTVTSAKFKEEMSLGKKLEYIDLRFGNKVFYKFGK
ncbi:MAG: hypothetical protein WC797_02230 [Candidatus Paceibacterota bacterium]|jgi:hypothetical protein